MTIRPKYHLITSVATLVAYGLLATGTLRSWHGFCGLADCHDAAFVSQDSDHHGESDGGTHAPDCPICHQLNVASNATLQSSSAGLVSAAIEILTLRLADAVASAQTVCTDAAPRAPPVCV